MENPPAPKPKPEARPRPTIEVETHPFTTKEVIDAMRPFLGLEENVAVATRDEKRNAEGLLFTFEFTAEGVPDKVFTFIAKGTHGPRNESAVTRVDWVSEDYMDGGPVAEYLEGTWVQK